MSLGIAKMQVSAQQAGSGGGTVGSLHYETQLTGVLGTDTIYTFTHKVGALILNNATQDPNLDYSGQGTNTVTFLTITPSGTSLLNEYIA